MAKHNLFYNVPHMFNQNFNAFISKQLNLPQQQQAVANEVNISTAINIKCI